MCVEMFLARAQRMSQANSASGDVESADAETGLGGGVKKRALFSG